MDSFGDNTARLKGSRLKSDDLSDVVAVGISDIAQLG